MLMPGRNSEELQQADNQAGQSPLHIEAENYLYQSGAIASESCSDAGGVQDLTNIGGSYYAVYSVTVAQAGTYLVKFRVAGSGGTFQFKDSSLNVLATVTVPNTGSGQTWTTITATVVLRAGTQQVHFYCTQPGWNLNWLEFVFRAGSSNSSNSSGAGGYRYGFNGKENDNEVKGEGDQQDYGMRIYDPRLGRFLSVDPLTKKYPELTPYQFAGDKPIWATDLDGEEEYYQNYAYYLKKQAILRLYDERALALRHNPILSNYDPSQSAWTSKWKNSNNFFAKITYSIANGFYTTGQQLKSSLTGQTKIENIGGGTYDAHGVFGENQRMEHFVDAATAVIPSAPAENIFNKTIGGILESKAANRIFISVEEQVTEHAAKRAEDLVQALSKVGGSKSASEFLGWGNKTTILKSAADFTKDQLIKSGYTKQVLTDIHSGLMEAAKKTIKSTGNLNPASIERAKQIESILNTHFK